MNKLKLGPQEREYLFSQAREKRTQIGPQIAVIAGSVGKTSVKEMVGSILRSWKPEQSFISPDNQNTKAALATQIFQLPYDCQVAAFEMGARRLHDFKIPLSYLQPSVVALLNIGSAHVGEFGSPQNLWTEKISCLDTESATSLVVPSDNHQILNHARKAGKNVLSFGYSEASTIRILNETSENVTLHIANESLVFKCPFYGAAKALNVAAAVAVAIALKAPLSAIQEGLRSFAGVPRRFQIFTWGRTMAIDDAFNASPESLKEGLHYLNKISNDKAILLVLGSLLELGDYSEQAHQNIAHLIKDLFASTSRLGVATVGEEAWTIHEELQSLGISLFRSQHFQSSDEARTLESWCDDFEVIYFKGSKSIQLRNIFSVP